MGFILSLISYILFPIVAITNFIVVMIKNATVFNFIDTMNKYWYDNAIEVDKIGNFHYRTFLNTIMIKKYGYKFGKINETISSVLGKNQRDRTLSIVGWVFIGILYILDPRFWFKGGHCLNSIK